MQIRIVSLEEADDVFGDDITRTNNRQNRIDSRDFVSQDIEQKRIKTELGVDGIQYLLMRSDEIFPDAQSFDLHESTTALACASLDIALIVQLKGQIGKIWDDLTKPPYKTLFNSGITGVYTWKCVQISRKIDSQLALIEKSHSNLREQKIVRYGNRLIAGLVFKDIDQEKLKDHNPDLSQFADDQFLISRTKHYAKKVVKYVQKEYSNSMIPNLFKNQTKSRDVFLKTSDQ